MWPSYHDAGVGLACVEQGITGVHDLPSDILTDWENLPDLDVGHQLQPLAWETTHEDSAALLADKLPDSGGQGYSIVAAEPTTDTQHHAAADTGRCKQEVNRLAQKKSRQKKQV